MVRLIVGGRNVTGTVSIARLSCKEDRELGRGGTVMKKLSTILLAAVICVAVLSACGAKNEGRSVSGTSGAGSGGAEAIYKKSCIACHGDNLEGTLGPGLQTVGAKLSLEQLKDKIENGGGGMPAYKHKLNDADIHTLAEWLSAKQ